MNKDTRKHIDDLLEQLEIIKGEIEEIRDEEQEKFDNLNEYLQNSEKGEAFTTAIDNLDSAVGSIEDVTSYLEEAKG